MELLKEIDERARVQNRYQEFRLFLEDLKTLEPDMNHRVTVDYVLEKMLQLDEVDFEGHMGMAQAAGLKGHETRPGIEKRFANPRLGLEEPPQQGQLVRANGEAFKIEETDGKIAFIQHVENAMKSMTVNVQDMKPIKTKNGQQAWVWMNPEAQ